MRGLPLFGRALVAATLFVLGLAPRVAVAQEPAPAAGDKLARAKALFFEANGLRQAGQLQAALDKYLASRALVPSQANTLNGAVCFAELGRYDEALDLYDTLIVEFGAGMDADAKKSVDDETAKLRPRVAELMVSGPAGADVLVDARSRTKLPLLHPLHLLPGARMVRISKDGFEPYDANVTAVAGARVAPIEAVLRPVAPGGGGGIGVPRIAGIALSAAGAVSLGIGIGFGVVAIGKKKDADPHCREGDLCDAEGVALRDQGLTASYVSTATLIGGAALAVAGVTLIAIGGAKPSGGEHARLSVSVSPNGAWLRGAW